MIQPRPFSARACPSIEMLDVALILLLAAIIRIVWMAGVHALWEFADLGEATHVALAIARHGSIADAFFASQGPTAHLLPGNVLLAGAILWLFGIDTVAANVALAVWGLIQTLASFALLYWAMGRAGLDRATRRLGLLLLAVSPAFLAQEAADFRVWEGALAVCLAAANLGWLFTLEQTYPVPTKALVVAAALAALAFFVSPPVGLAINACWALFTWRRLKFGQALHFAALGAAALLLILTPWMVRNDLVLGRAIWLRSNFGLELALGNHPAALSGMPRKAVYDARVKAIHPYNSPIAAARVREMGEITYADRLGAEAWRWIAGHPGDFVELTLRHYRQYYFPDFWQLRETIWRNWILPRAMMIWLVSLLGFASLAIGLFRRRTNDLYIAVYVLIAGLPYALVQPVPRYSYLVYGLLTMLAARLIVDAARYLTTGSIGIAR
jgi:hypothetical protein